MVFVRDKSHRSKWMMTEGTPMTQETTTSDHIIYPMNSVCFRASSVGNHRTPAGSEPWLSSDRWETAAVGISSPERGTWLEAAKRDGDFIGISSESNGDSTGIYCDLNRIEWVAWGFNMDDITRYSQDRMGFNKIYCDFIKFNGLLMGYNEQ